MFPTPRSQGLLTIKGRICNETKEKILSIARELNYRPDFIARSLVMKRTKTLGLVMTSILNPFYTELAQGIEATAIELGYNIILCCTHSDVSVEKQYVEMLRSKGVDGIIFTSAHIRRPQYLGTGGRGVSYRPGQSKDVPPGRQRENRLCGRE